MQAAPPHQPCALGAASKRALSNLRFERRFSGMQSSPNAEKYFRLLSDLALLPDSAALSSRAESAGSMTQADFDAFISLSAKNHVVLRALTRLQEVLTGAKYPNAETLHTALRNEKIRIDRALGFLTKICATLAKRGLPVTVIKSLDHWPDLGGDLDLYTDADAGKVVEVMRTAFHAKVDNRSWGDRLANKWNFVVPGLPELVEIHIGRLGQTGEQTAVTESLAARTRSVSIGSYSYPVLAAEHRIIVSTLQRMYRHFYIRLCDIVDNALLIDTESVDFAYLHNLGRAAGIWQGIATYLAIISGYVESYRGYGVPLPSIVTESTKFRADQVRFRRDFLRVPILPHSLNLYTAELRTLVLRGQLRDSFRLSLLPGLATAAALELKITGSDKGIW
jgi:hypothetical protein